MYLYLNTADYKFMTLGLINIQGQVLYLEKIKAEYQQAEKLLLNLEKILLNQDKKWRLSLKGVIAVLGPGGFTSLRIGIATANALAWSLQIPICGVKLKFKEGIMPEKLQDGQLIGIGVTKLKKIKKFKQILPFYGSGPHITIKKRLDTQSL